MTLWSLQGRLWRGLSATWHSFYPSGQRFSWFSFFFEQGILYMSQIQTTSQKACQQPVFKIVLPTANNALAGERPEMPVQSGQQHRRETMFYVVCCCRLLSRTDFVNAISKGWDLLIPSLIDESPIGVASNRCCGLTNLNPWHSKEGQHWWTVSRGED